MQVCAGRGTTAHRRGKVPVVPSGNAHVGTVPREASERTGVLASCASSQAGELGYVCSGGMDTMAMVGTSYCVRLKCRRIQMGRVVNCASVLERIEHRREGGVVWVEWNREP